MPTDTAASTTSVSTSGLDSATVTESVEVVNGIILAQTTKADGTEEIVVEVRKRFSRATPGSGAWTEVAF